MRINDEQQKTPPRPPFPFSEFPCPSFLAPWRRRMPTVNRITVNRRCQFQFFSFSVFQRFSIFPCPPIPSDFCFFVQPLFPVLFRDFRDFRGGKFFSFLLNKQTEGDMNMTVLRRWNFRSGKRATSIAGCITKKMIDKGIGRWGDNRTPAVQMAVCFFKSCPPPLALPCRPPWGDSGAEI